MRLVLEACTVDLGRLQVLGSGTIEPLTPLEGRLVAHFARHAGTVLSQAELLRDVWGYAPTARTRTVRTTVSRLRAKIERDPSAPRVLVTEVGRGYRWTGPAPAARDVFVGRADALTEVAAALQAGPVTITGAGGVGKTRLARELRRSRPGWLCELAGADSRPALERGVAEVLGVTLAGASDPVARIGRVLAARAPALLVLDNLEQLRPHVVQTVGRWVGCGVDVLCTSRVPLGLDGERVVRLEPLGPLDAAQLFRARAADAGALDPDDVADICARLDGMPLAIELVAPWCRVWSAGGVRLRLAEGFALARASSAGRPARHRSLAAALEGSLALLDGPVRAALVGSCVFRAPFTADAFAAVVQPADPGVLAELYDHALLRRIDGDGVRRFAPVEATRSALAAELSGATRARHVQWAVERAESGFEDIELPDLVAAQVGTGDPASSARLALALAPRLVARGPVSLVLELVERALSCQPPGAEAELELLVALGQALRRALRFDDAQAALDLAEARVGPQTSVEVRCALEAARGQLAVYRGESGKGRFARALELAEVSGDVVQIAVMRRLLASAPRPEGRLAEAEALLSDAVAALEAVDAPRELALTLVDLGELHAFARHPRRADHFLDRALALFARHGDAHGLATTTLRRGENAMYAGDLERAVALLEEARERALAIGLGRAEALALGRLGTLHCELGDLVAAEEALVAAARMHRDAGDSWGVDLIEVERAVVALRIGDAAGAVGRLRPALARIEARGAQLYACIALQWLGVACWAAGDRSQARVHLWACERACAELDRGDTRAETLLWLALLDESVELVERARAVHEPLSWDERAFAELARRWLRDRDRGVEPVRGARLAVAWGLLS